MSYTRGKINKKLKRRLFINPMFLFKSFGDIEI
jgi:hypothetical protein